MYKINTDVFYKVVNEKKILLVELSKEENTILQIEGISSHVFLAAIKGEAVDSIIDRISGEYQVTREQVAGDCQKFLGELIDKGILFES